MEEGVTAHTDQPVGGPPKAVRFSDAETSRLEGMFHSELADVDEAVGLLPDKSTMSSEERRATAAVCIVRAMSNLAPAASPPGRWRLFMLMHNTYYWRFIALIVVGHIALSYREAPPALYGASDSKIVEAGYWERWKTILIDVLVCIAYNVHCVMLYKIEWWKGVRYSPNLLLFVVVGLLNIDMLCNIAFFSVRPFRCIRPLVYSFSSSQQTIMLNCCMHTLASVAKIFTLLAAGLLFFSAVGMNIFRGTVTPVYHNNSIPISPTNGTTYHDNILGAACWVEAGEKHPFGTFGEAFVNMYVLATTENFPDIIWPFYTCSCEYVSNAKGGIAISWATDKYCTYRHWATCIFFVSYLIIVFFCLGNSVLGVCYFWFEKIMKHNVMLSGLRQRFSLITAFYYLEEAGGVTPEAFVDCAKFMRRVCPGTPGTEDGDLLFFRYLDRDASGRLNLSEFFKVGELMRANVLVHKAKYRIRAYERWKTSEGREKLVKLVEYSIFGASALELCVVCIIIIDYILAVTPSTLGHTEATYANVTAIILVLEAVVKASAYGIIGYWADFWNKVDFYITVSSVIAAIIDVSSDAGVLNAPVYALRLLRVLRFVSLLNNVGRTSPSEGGEHTDSFFSKLLESFATAVPVCGNMLLLVFVYVYFFAMITMEFLASSTANSKQVSTDSGLVDFRAGDKFETDWADTGASLMSVLIINVGNNWNDVMNRAELSAGTPWVFLLFVIMHFVGVFLLLNIIQSLFVFTFSTFLNHKEFQKTVEYNVQRQLEKLHRVSATSFKKIRRTPRLEFLLLSWDDLDREYERWLDNQAMLNDDKRYVDFGTSKLRVAPLDQFFHAIDLTKPLLNRHDSGRFLSVGRSQQIEEFLKKHIGATEERAPSRFRRLSTFTEEATSPTKFARAGSTASSTGSATRASHRRSESNPPINTDSITSQRNKKFAILRSAQSVGFVRQRSDLTTGSGDELMATTPDHDRRITPVDDREALTTDSLMLVDDNSKGATNVVSPSVVSANSHASSGDNALPTAQVLRDDDSGDDHDNQKINNLDDGISTTNNSQMQHGDYDDDDDDDDGNADNDNQNSNNDNNNTNNYNDNENHDDNYTQNNDDGNNASDTKPRLPSLGSAHSLINLFRTHSPRPQQDAEDHNDAANDDANDDDDNPNETLSLS